MEKKSCWANLNLCTFENRMGTSGLIRIVERQNGTDTVYVCIAVRSDGHSLESFLKGFLRGASITTVASHEPKEYCGVGAFAASLVSSLQTRWRMDYNRLIEPYIKAGEPLRNQMPFVGPSIVPAHYTDHEFDCAWTIVVGEPEAVFSRKPLPATIKAGHGDAPPTLSFKDFVGSSEIRTE